MKKTIKAAIYCLFLALAITACKEEDEKFPTHEPPVWLVDYNVGYYENMTAVVTVPANLAGYAGENDQLAAFSVDGACRGVGELGNEGKAYYVSIKGTPEDQSGIYFMYYNARNKYLYRTDDMFSYDASRIYGTADEPKELPLIVVK